MTTLSELKLSPTQISALVVLMAEARPLSNPEMKELAGFDLSSGRKDLEEHGLVESPKKEGYLRHSLTEYGWRMSRELLRITELNGSGKAVAGALRVLMNAIDRGLQTHRLSPKEMFYTGEPPKPESGLPAEMDVEHEIRLVYKKFATKPGSWVRLAEIRSNLVAVDKTAMDTALKSLANSGDAQFIPVANLKSLSDEDRDAAIKVGGELKHLIAIEG